MPNTAEYIANVSICYIEKQKAQREEREVAIIAVLADMMCRLESQC
jgi:hypothetical protein